MSKKVIIVVGSGDARDRATLKRCATRKSRTTWTCPLDTRKGDTLLIYAQKSGTDLPEGAIIAAATADEDAASGDGGKSQTTLRSIRYLENPVPLSRIRDEFPQWRWAKHPQASPYLIDEHADKAKCLLELISTRKSNE